MEHGDPITKKKKEKLVKNLNIESAKADSKYFENTYGIDHIKIVEATHYSYDPKWILEKRRIFQMENNINNNKSLTYEYNILSNILNLTKRAKTKNSH